MSRVGLFAALGLVLLGGCRSLPFAPPRAVGACPGEVVPTQEIAGEFALQFRVRVVADGVDLPLRVAVEKRGELLVVVGLDPFGAKLLSVHQRGSDFEVEAAPAPVLPVAPENLLRDLHRVRFLAADSEQRDGERLRSRRFETSRGSVLVEFDEAAREATVVHPGCGYFSHWVELPGG